MKLKLLLFMLMLSVSTWIFADQVENNDKKTLNPNIQEEKVIVNVQGMVCDFCAQGLEKMFMKKKGVQSIRIDLEASQVILALEKKNTLDNHAIIELIRNNGINTVTINRSWVMNQEEGLEKNDDLELEAAEE